MDLLGGGDGRVGYVLTMLQVLKGKLLFALNPEGMKIAVPL
jgi:hypothetical protein